MFFRRSTITWIWNCDSKTLCNNHRTFYNVKRRFKIYKLLILQFQIFLFCCLLLLTLFLFPNCIFIFDKRQNLDKNFFEFFLASLWDIFAIFLFTYFLQLLLFLSLLKIFYIFLYLLVSPIFSSIFSHISYFFYVFLFSFHFILVFSTLLVFLLFLLFINFQEVHRCSAQIKHFFLYIHIIITLNLEKEKYNNYLLLSFLLLCVIILFFAFAFLTTSFTLLSFEIFIYFNYTVFQILSINFNFVFFSSLYID